MQQVAGMDGMFLSIDESQTASAVMGGLVVFDAAPDPEAGSLASVRARIAQRLDGIPPLRWVRASVPVGMNNAYWAEVDKLDVRAHTRQVRVPAPGTDRELAETVARLMQVPLAQGRPLWEYVVLTGLSSGRVAHLLRIHHGLVDGSMIPVIINLLSDRPTVAPNPRDSRAAAGGPAGRLRLAARGVVNTAMTPVRLVVLQAKTSVFLVGRVKQDGPLFLPAYLARMLPGTFAKPLTAVINGQQRLFGRPEVKSVVPLVRAPKSPFNGKVTQRRSFAFGEVPLHEVKAVAKAHGATLNDVVVSCCAGALRRYLLSTGEVPQEPLIVCIPYSVRGDDDKQPWANHVTTIFAELPTNIEDPLAAAAGWCARRSSQRGRTSRRCPPICFEEASNFIPQTLLEAVGQARRQSAGLDAGRLLERRRGQLPWTRQADGDHRNTRRRALAGRLPDPGRRSEYHRADLHRQALRRDHGLPRPARGPQPPAGLLHRRARRPRHRLRCHGARAQSTTRPPAPGELIAGQNPTDKERE